MVVWRFWKARGLKLGSQPLPGQQLVVTGLWLILLANVAMQLARRDLVEPYAVYATMVCLGIIVVAFIVMFRGSKLLKAKNPAGPAASGDA